MKRLPCCMVTGKKSYRSRAQARSVRVLILGGGGPEGFKPKREYRCTHCGRWHLTSKA